MSPKCQVEVHIAYRWKLILDSTGGSCWPPERYLKVGWQQHNKRRPHHYGGSLQGYSHAIMLASGHQKRREHSEVDWHLFFSSGNTTVSIYANNCERINFSYVLSNKLVVICYTVVRGLPRFFLSLFLLSNIHEMFLTNGSSRALNPRWEPLKTWKPKLPFFPTHRALKMLLIHELCIWSFNL